MAHILCINWANGDPPEFVDFSGDIDRVDSLERVCKMHAGDERDARKMAAWVRTRTYCGLSCHEILLLEHRKHLRDELADLDDQLIY